MNEEADVFQEIWLDDDAEYAYHPLEKGKLYPAMNTIGLRSI